jgi:serine/threonine-protein phosphatase PGAM5
MTRMAHRTLFLIRHGQYDPGVKSEPFGSKLTLIGNEQAERTADLFSTIPLTRIYSSCMTRAVETAQIIASRHPALEVTQYEYLKEITPPLPYLALKLMKDVSVDEIMLDRLHIEEAFMNFFKPAGVEDEYEAIICHGNVIRYFACRVLQVPVMVWMSMEINNASVTSVEIDKYGNSILLSYNETGHLSEELKTQNLSLMGIGRKYAQPEIEAEAPPDYEI